MPSLDPTSPGQPRTDRHTIRPIPVRPAFAGPAGPSRAPGGRFTALALIAVLAALITAGLWTVVKFGKDRLEEPAAAPATAPAAPAVPPTPVPTALAPTQPPGDPPQTLSRTPEAASAALPPAPGLGSPASPEPPGPAEIPTTPTAGPQNPPETAVSLPYDRPPDPAPGNAAPDSGNSDFHRLMSQGLAALDKGDLTTARARLTRARAIRPADSGVMEAMDQLDQAGRLTEIERLRRSAQKAEAAEDWEAALAAYLAVTRLDADIQFAAEGRQRALNRIEKARQVDDMLAFPRHLASDANLAKAEAILTEADLWQPKGPQLSAKLEALRRLVAAARTPVRVTLTSDGQTEVSVYRVGRLGRFDLRELDLRPGDYTLVGTRDGYRDVRLTLTLEPGAPPTRVSVVCATQVGP